MTPPSAHEAAVADLLNDALYLRDASLVIFRSKLLVEFKTAQLDPKLTEYVESGFRSWQVGGEQSHHCHVNLADVVRVWFDAEPVSCQGGRYNYTIWFLTDTDCGNPFRPTALFSVTLNGPYDAVGQPDAALIRDVYGIYETHRDRAFVGASETFLEIGRMEALPTYPPLPAQATAE
ncbi:MAG: hypothetical protein KIT73_10980 [Burkholderiales bacterium]|nr:hypothetical protein [Burkholderiales bacterium]